VRFRPCIDLHNGRVKQIVGSTLRDSCEAELVTNFESDTSPAHFAEMYRRDGLVGGHVIKLGPGNDAAAAAALAAYPGGLQLGGGVTPENASSWLERGAAQVIVTSYVFVDERFSPQRLRQLAGAVGRERLVLDLSCRRVGSEFRVAANRWQTITDLAVGRDSLAELSAFCSEFLVHAADVEGKQGGVDEELIAALADWSPIPVTYAGGIRCMDDVRLVERLGGGRVDVTVGSALDIFGGRGLRYDDLVAYDRARRELA